VIANEHAKLTTAGTPVGANVMRAFILDRMTGAHNSEVPAGDGVGMWSGSEPGLLGLVKPGSLTGRASGDPLGRDGAFHRVDREIGRGVVLMRTRLAIRKNKHGRGEPKSLERDRRKRALHRGGGRPTRLETSEFRRWRTACEAHTKSNRQK
jgi:hypothetical protein